MNKLAIREVAITCDEESFHLLMMSGDQLSAYTLSPKHAKRLLLLLQLRIYEYEKIFGELKTQLPAVEEIEEDKKEMGFHT